MANTQFPSPCLSCLRVKNPEDCNNKNCDLWRLWFTGRWEAMRTKILADMGRSSQSPKGVNIGGRYYAPPHQVREYLQTDPCTNCPYKGAFCTKPCRARRAWADAKKEVLL